MAVCWFGAGCEGTLARGPPLAARAAGAPAGGSRALAHGNLCGAGVLWGAGVLCGAVVVCGVVDG